MKEKPAKTSKEVSQEDQEEVCYEDLRFLSIDTKMIFEVSKEDFKKLQIFIELKKECIKKDGT